MNDSEFHQLADQLMLNIEAILDSFTGDSDIDCEP
ncbi:iron donor protein CyaY, partial [Bacillus velezensis]